MSRRIRSSSIFLAHEENFLSDDPYGVDPHDVGWYGDLGNFLVTPATAGYYAVRLTKYDVLAELTAAPHTAMMRFTFPASDQARIQVDLAPAMPTTPYISTRRSTGR